MNRIWRHDPGVWRPGDASAAAIRHRLGWLDLPRQMGEALGEIQAFAGEARHGGFREATLLGMGGSSLCAEVLRDAIGPEPGWIALRVLDTTDPATIRAAAGPSDRTLFLVASKSGSTIEIDTLERFFAARVEAERGASAGLHFAAITDAGSPLQRRAADRAYRKIFLNPADVGGRYSALSFFGLAPAALMGIDAGGLLASAREMAEACRASAPENPGLALGAFMGTAALEGRDKLTVLLPSAFGSLGAWIEQLVAESTGKQNRGLLPVLDEALDDPDRFGPDRLFVAVFASGPRDRPASAGPPGRPASAGPSPDVLDELERRGHPVFRIDTSPDALGAELFRWEFAVAIAAALLGVNPFDEPNVKEAKDRTGRLLGALGPAGQLEEATRVGSGAEVTAAGTPAADDPVAALRSVLRATRPGDYFALLSFLPPETATDEILLHARRALRQRLRVPVTISVGPRYLHSTGQYYKGGPDRGVFVMLTCDDEEDVPIPGLPYSFGTLKRAQAVGDLQALEAHGRRVLRLHFPAEPQRRELALRSIFDAALKS